jgi:hypothetical protein
MSAQQLKSPSEQLALGLRPSLFGAHRRSCCPSSPSENSGKSSAHGSGGMGLGATSGEVEEHVKWVAEWIERSDSRTDSHPAPLGQVSRAAAPLVAETLTARNTVVDKVQSDSSSPLRGDHSPPHAFAPLQPRQASTQWALGSTPVPLSDARSFRVSGLATIILLTVLGFLVTALPVSTLWHRQADDHTFALASSSSAKVGQRSQPGPRLVAREARGVVGEPVPLGLTLRGEAPGGAVIVAGLAPGMTLSSGRPVGANAWQVAATDLADTWIGPPQNFFGVVKLDAELHLPDRATIAHRESIRVEWIRGVTGSDQAPIAPTSADSTSARSGRVPTSADSTALDQARSAQAASEQASIATRPAGTEQISVAAAPPEVGTAPHQLDKAEIVTKVNEKPLATKTQNAASGQEKPFATSQVGTREFIDRNGSVQVILPKRQSKPIAETRAVKPIRDGASPASDRTNLRSGAAPTAIVAGSVSAESARVDVAVMIGGEGDLDACSSPGEVTGLDPSGDGFLSVRSGPGGRPYREIDRLFNGNEVYLCGSLGPWYSIVYHQSRKPHRSCGVSTPWPKHRAYSGPCQYGWVHSRYIKGTAG